MDRYIYIRSEDSDTFFSDNQTHKFKVHLKTPLHLPGKWKVGLVHFYALSKGGKVKPGDGLYVYSDICKESIVFGEERPLLRRMEQSNRNEWSYDIDNPYYLPLRMKYVTEFEVYIRHESDKAASDLLSPVYLTLHLKPYPFLQEQ
jgi:hypothetical protein